MEIERCLLYICVWVCGFIYVSMYPKGFFQFPSNTFTHMQWNRIEPKITCLRSNLLKQHNHFCINVMKMFSKTWAANIFFFCNLPNCFAWPYFNNGPLNWPLTIAAGSYVSFSLSLRRLPKQQNFYNQHWTLYSLLIPWSNTWLVLPAVSMLCIPSWTHRIKLLTFILSSFRYAY